MVDPKFEQRVLVYAPIGRDAPASASLLTRSGIAATICPTFADLVAGLKAGAGAAFLAEEGLFGQEIGPLTQWVTGQPAWSELPFIVLTSRHEQARVRQWRQDMVAVLRNVSLLERPIQPITLTSTMQTALRARQRQYEIRALLEARERTAQELERLVAERTHALEEANIELRKQMAERARAEENLRHAQKIEAIGQLTGGIAHDFNNLLMVISGGLQMLEHQTNPARRQRVMDGMRQSAQRGAALTRQLLAFSRRQALRPEPVDILQQIGGMHDLLDHSLRGDIDVRFELAEDLWPVFVDPGELELVVINLAVNARDAMAEGGTLTVKAENCPDFRDHDLDGDYVCLSVIDTGSGMTPEVLARVFEPFFTTKDVGKGSGLGLPQVHGFATQSRGAVHVESEPGRGTAIRLYLPRSEKPASARPESAADLHRLRNGNARTGAILLVEDDDEVAAMVGEMLDQLGYDVFRTASAPRLSAPSPMAVISTSCSQMS
jgi:signal transduction histidine kinase